MLVCGISKTRDPTSIAAVLAEPVIARDAPGIESSILAALVDETTTAVAEDAVGIENNVFGALVDDPASVGEILDAYLGEIMLEAASADAIVDGSIPATYAVDVAESVTAIDAPDGVVVSVPTTVTWEAATVAAVTLSAGDLAATNTGTTATNQGAHVASTSGKTSGKYYYETTITTLKVMGNGSSGIGTVASTYTNMGNGGTTGDVCYWNGGNIWANNANTGSSLGVQLSGNVWGIAVDLDNRKIWFRVAPSGNWNGSGTANPASNTGGITIPAGTMVPFLTFGGTGGQVGGVITANFGASAFAGAVPSGFTSGWPI